MSDRISALETLLDIFGAPSGTLPGSNGLVPKPPAGSADFLLRGDRGWENPSKFATPTQISTAINALTGDAPITLNTLQELAAALANDPNFATTVMAALNQKLSKTGDETIAGNKTFAEAVRIQGLFPGIWLDETDHTVKGAYLVIDGGMLQVQRRSANFGGFEASLVLVDIVTGAVTLLSTAQAISITTGCLSLRGGFSVAGNIVTSLPTSSAGLPSGALWRNGNIVNVV